MNLVANGMRFVTLMLRRTSDVSGWQLGGVTRGHEVVKAAWPGKADYLKHAVPITRGEWPLDAVRVSLVQGWARPGSGTRLPDQGAARNLRARALLSQRSSIRPKSLSWPATASDGAIASFELAG